LFGSCFVHTQQNKQVMRNKNFFGTNSAQAILKWRQETERLMRLKISFLFLAILFLMVWQANAQSVSPKIHPTDLTNSNNFKSNQGGDRLLFFQKLENLIKPASSFDGPAPQYDYFIGDYKMSADDLIFLLGEPDVKIAPAVWQYYLTANQTCRAIIGIDEDGMISYVVSKNCL